MMGEGYFHLIPQQESPAPGEKSDILSLVPGGRQQEEGGNRFESGKGSGLPWGSEGEKSYLIKEMEKKTWKN